MGQNCKIWGVKKIWQRFLEAEPLDSKPHQTPRGCCNPPKMVPPYSLGTYPPTTPRHFDAPSLLHRENIDFLKTPDFGQSTQTALELPKIYICQNWPQGVLGDVSSCLETKFDKKCQWEVSQIANRYGIRWFKCKLKPPKNAQCEWALTSDDQVPRKKLTEWGILNAVWFLSISISKSFTLLSCGSMSSFHGDCNKSQILQICQIKY